MMDMQLPFRVSRRKCADGLTSLPKQLVQTKRKNLGQNHRKLMNVIFSILSVIYISAIFLFSDSPMVSNIAKFNPYSLFHIPLYGILTVFIVFSFFPLLRWRSYTINQKNQSDDTDQTNRFLFAGLIALGVAVVDEVHQTSIPGRDGSFTDVFLDAIGIALVLLLIHRIFRWKISSKPNHSLI